MRYVGEMMLNNQLYTLELTKNNNSERIDFRFMLPALMFSSKNADLVTSCCRSLFVVDNVKYYGDFSILKEYDNILNILKFQTFKDGDITETNDFTVDGNVKYFKGVTKDYEQEIKLLNGEDVYFYGRVGNNYIKYEYIDTKTVTTPLKDVEYKERKMADDKSTALYGLTFVQSLSIIGMYKDLTWLDKKDYKIINTKEDFDRMIAFLNIYHGAIGFDTETTGLKINRLETCHPSRDNLVGICLSWEGDQGVYIPIRHLCIDNLDENYVMEQLKPILEEKFIVTHYGQFDAKVVYTYGIFLNICADTYAIQNMINNADAKESTGLKYMTNKYLKIDQIELSDIFVNGGEDAIQFQILPYEIVRAYACADADFTLAIYNLIKDKLPKQSVAMYAEELEYMKGLSLTEYYGNKVNMDLMYELHAKNDADVEVLEEEIYKLVGKIFGLPDRYKFNINSNDVISDILYNKLQCPKIVKVKNNPTKAAVDAKALRELAKLSNDGSNNFKYDYDILTKYEVEFDPEDKENLVLIDGKYYAKLITKKSLNKLKYPIIKLLQLYRKKIKWKTTVFAMLIRENTDGYLFAGFNQFRAATGRTISSGPNMQQLVKGLKKLIIPFNNDEYYMVVADFKQIEYRAMVSLAGDLDIIDRLKDWQQDFHRIIGGRLLRKEPYQVTDKERKRMKQANFGIPFDMGGKALAELLFGYPITPERIEEAMQLKRDYLDSMPKTRDMFKHFRDYAQTYGSVMTYFGRVRNFPNLPNETDEYIISRDRRKAGNTPVQGTAADILKIGVNRLWKRFLNKSKERAEQLNGGLIAHITNLVHDEVIIVAHKSYHVYELIKDLRECMELKIPNFAPLFLGICVVDNWGEAKKDAYEIPVELNDIFMAKYNKGMIDEPCPTYKDLVFKQINMYLDLRFKSYLAELGLDINNPHDCDFNHVVEQFTHVYLGPKIKDFYSSKQGEGIEYSIIEFVKAKTGEDISYKLNELEFKREEEESEIKLYDYLDEYLYSEDDESFDDSVVDMNEYRKAHNIDLEYDDVPLTAFENNFTRIFVMNDSLIIKVDNLSQANFRKLNNYLKNENVEEGSYKVIYSFNNQLVELNSRVNNVNRDLIEAIVKSEDNISLDDIIKEYSA